jgi:hypothetical protein
MNPCELATYVTAAACFIFDQCTEDELLRTMGAQKLFCHKQDDKLLRREAGILINRNTCPCALFTENITELNSNNAAGNTVQNTSNRNPIH